MVFQQQLLEHLQHGSTTVARAWSVTCKDGKRLGFTDHDMDLTFDGIVFSAASGLSASAIERATGLSVDNAEAVGVLTAASVTEADIEAGRFDGAEVHTWLVNWADVSQRSLLFRGSIGEIRRTGGAFVAELRGLSERLNLPRGRVYQRPCAAVLGDKGCRFDVSTEGYFAQATLQEVSEGRLFSLPALDGFEPKWFERGTLHIESGPGSGLKGLVKQDVSRQDGTRVIALWESLRADVGAGDTVTVVAGCDKRFETCCQKFSNQLNFQGFPDIPGEDWVTSYPTSSGANTGGSLR